MFQTVCSNIDFKYIDSSEQEDEMQSNWGDTLNFSELQYTDSSEDNQFVRNQQNIQPDFQQRNQKKKLKTSKNPKKLCHLNPDKFLLHDNYVQQLENLVMQNKQKISKKTPLLIQNTDKQILQNLQKRSKNYQFFLNNINIDRRYKHELSKKVNKLKKQNQRKQQIIKNKKAEKILEDEQTEMRKYMVDKQFKQDQVLTKVQQHAYKLGIERIRNKEKEIKHQIKKIGSKRQLQQINLENKQKQQLQVLKQQLQAVKQAKRLNKLEQKKVFKDLQKQTQQQKQLLLTKVQSIQNKTHKKFIV